MQEMQETQFQSLGQENLLEEDMATCSSILAWKVKSHINFSMSYYLIFDCLIWASQATQW